MHRICFIASGNAAKTKVRTDVFPVRLPLRGAQCFAAAESRIRDANIAEESANLTRYNILTQSGIAALAQANQQASSVLRLLQ